MSEIEKMYENCNIKPKQEGYCGWDSDCPYPHHKCNDECPYWKHEDIAKYPPFTPEKQLELIKWLGEKDYTVRIDFNENEWGIATEKYSGYFQDDLSDALASIINTTWQDLTEEEKQQVKGILE
ncbi:MAG: hypothetical protein IIZ99_00160 [Turicibacter sp.]|nr:hypothetical protein [Turicibacter sp.]